MSVTIAFAVDPYWFNSDVPERVRVLWDMMIGSPEVVSEALGVGVHASSSSPCSTRAGHCGSKMAWLQASRRSETCIKGRSGIYQRPWALCIDTTCVVKIIEVTPDDHTG
jgi:hypothetical protein